MRTAVQMVVEGSPPRAAGSDVVPSSSVIDKVRLHQRMVLFVRKQLRTLTQKLTSELELDGVVDGACLFVLQLLFCSGDLSSETFQACTLGETEESVLRKIASNRCQVIKSFENAVQGLDSVGIFPNLKKDLRVPNGPPKFALQLAGECAIRYAIFVLEDNEPPRVRVIGGHETFLYLDFMNLNRELGCERVVLPRKTWGEATASRGAEFYIGLERQREKRALGAISKIGKLPKGNKEGIASTRSGPGVEDQAASSSAAVRVRGLQLESERLQLALESERLQLESKRLQLELEREREREFANATSSSSSSASGSAASSSSSSASGSAASSFRKGDGSEEGHKGLGVFRYLPVDLVDYFSKSRFHRKLGKMNRL